MVLESLRPDAPVNINHLVLESPRKPEVELPFDPKRDITEDDLKAMDEEAKANFEEGYTWNVVDTCASLKLLFPNRPQPVDFKANEDLEVIREFFIHGGTRFAKLLYPEKTISDYGEAERDYLDDSLHVVTQDAKRNFYNFGFLEQLKLFYPEAIQPLLTDKEAVKNSLDEQIGRYRNEERWEQLAETASNARIVLEDDFDLKLSAEDWHGMHNQLENSRNPDFWYEFAEIAADMMILAAEKVRVIPNEGLVLTMPQLKPDFRQHIPPLPHMRRF